MGTEALCMCLKGLLLPRLGVLSHSLWKNGCVVSAPSLHREAIDSIFLLCIYCIKVHSDNLLCSRL